jgi:hypothetical protein
MSETIIIEANREIAYKQEVEAYKYRNINEGGDNLVDYKWKTQIPSGLQMEVGDQICVEATMIQQKGSPEQTI